MNKKSTEIIVSAIVAIAVVGSGGYYLGFQEGVDQTKSIVVKNISEINAPDNISTDFGLFWEVWDKIRSEHIKGAELEDQNLVYGAIEGLVGAIGDPHTSFFSPEDSKKFNEDINGNFSGIGAEIGIRDSKLVVISPLEDSPAQNAGLQPGDHIIQIDGESTIEIKIEEAVKKIRGEIGTVVTLTVLREGVDGSNDYDITRGNIAVPTVKWELMDDNIIYLQMFSFNGNSTLAFQKAMVSGLLAGGKGLVFDLRGNPGGYLDVSVKIAGFFLERGNIVVTEKFTSGDETVLRARGNEALKNFPVVILVNKGSASASEILAGALRVHNGTKIVGEQSFGKGTVQELQPLSGNSTLKITIANWLLPNGDLIEGNGLEPDIIVEFTEEDIEAKRDVQLEKAIEVLKEEMNK